MGRHTKGAAAERDLFSTVLEQAGIVISAKAGRVRTCQLLPGGLGAAADWIGRQQLPAERRLDRLGDFLDRSGASKERTT